MPCTDEFTRWQDKYELWEIAHADVDDARAKALIADGLMVTACEVAIFTGGGGGWTAAGCVAALAGLAAALSSLETAVDKANMRAESADAAGAAYHACIAACRRPSG